MLAKANQALEDERENLGAMELPLIETGFEDEEGEDVERASEEEEDSDSSSDSV